MTEQHWIALIFSIVALLIWFRKGSVRTVSARDVYVVDGDTLGIKTPKGRSERVRIANFNAPETRGLKSLWEGPLGESAKRELKNLIWQAEYLEIHGDRRDKYGRTLAHVTAVTPTGSFDIGRQMIRKGHNVWWR